MTAIKRPRKLSTDPNRRIKRFRYVPFSEQIAKISMDHVTTSLSMPAQPTDKETFFIEAINKWIELNSGNEFKNFLSEINHTKLTTYVQLLHQQKNIAETLAQHLLIDQNQALPALIEILIGFARDLREDFFSYLWEFFDILIKLIDRNVTNIELLESCFFCLSVFFKLQWRELAKSLRKILIRLMPLFASKNLNIRRFIAEVSSFLLRKAQNIGKITTFLVERSNKAEDEHVTDGIVQLFFNTVKGLHGQFQSRHIEFLSTFVDTILQMEEQGTRDHGIGLMEGVMRECSRHGNVESYKPIVNSLLQRVESVLEGKSTNLIAINACCGFIEVWLKECDGGKFMENETLLAICVKTMGSGYSTSQTFLQLCAHAVLLSSNSALSTRYIREIMDKSVEMFGENLSEVALIFEFYGKIVDLAFFDVHCLDRVGKLSEKVINQGHLNEISLRTILDFYFKHTLKRHPIQLFPPEDATSKNNLGVHKSFVLELQSILGASENYTSVFYPMALVILPWFSRHNESLKSTKSLLDTFNSQIKESEQQSMLNIWLLAYHIALTDRSLFANIKTNDLISFLSQNAESELALRTCLIVMSSTNQTLGESKNGIECFAELLEILKPAIIHPSSSMRKVALQILKQNEEVLNFNGKESIFDVLLAVEEHSILFENFRERAALLRRVRYGSLQQYLPTEFAKKLEKMTFGFILAQYFEKLTVYWPMVAEIAGSYRENNSSDDFWEVMGDYIEQSNEYIREQKTSIAYLPNFEDESTSQAFLEIRGETDRRVDFWAFRLEILKLLSKEFVVLAERKHRYLIQIFFDIYETEFQNVTANVKKFDDITSVTWFESNKDDTSIKDIVVEESTIDESIEAMEVDDIKQVKKLDRKLVKNTLNALMTIFAKFSNLKSAYKSPEIYNVLNELLRANDIQIQKSALACIFCFKNKALEPYRQNFINLVEEKAFRDELLHFSVDEENTVIKEDHREHVIPVLLKLLDGKMNTHSGKNVPRKPVIFRFVAGCRPDELELFLKIVFWNINDSIDMSSIHQTCVNIASNYDPTKTVALSRITNTLECLEEIYKRLAQSFNAQQNAYVYQITIACHVLIRLGLEHTKTSAHYKKILRSLRIRAFDLLSTLFNAFQRREFAEDELNVLFELCVRPYLQPGKDDVPWAILRFFGKLTEIPYFYPLLNVPVFSASSEQPEQTPLGFLCESLFSPMSTPGNKLFVVECCLNLLTFFNDQPNVKLPQLPQASLSVDDNERPFGTRLIITVVPRLLAYLKIAIPRDVKLGNYSATASFSLLEKISGFTNDSSISNELASLLLPFVEAGYLRKDEHLSAILISIGNFLIHDKTPDVYFSRVAPFLSSFRTRKSRTGLVQLLNSLGSNKYLNPQLKEHIKRLEELESWHTQRINEPDYERRHEAMAELTKIYETISIESDIDVEILLTALRSYVHSHFYALSSIDEISIRSASSNCLRLIIELLKKSPQLNLSVNNPMIENFIVENFIPLIQRITKTNNENVRHEVVNLLAMLVDNFGSEIEVLKPFCQLRNVENPDQCFFENVTHLQIHRRQRAFIRLAASIESNEVEIPLTTLDKFITPLVSPYLLQTEAKYVPLSDEAIRLFAVIMKKQPWATYHRTLTFYIDAVNNEEERNKPLIRVLVAVLGAFNFDVSDTELPKGVNEEKMAREKAKKLAKLKKKGKKIVKRKKFVSYSGVKKTKDTDQLPNLNELNDEDKINSLSPNQRILATILRVIIPRLRKTIRPPQEFHAHKKAQKGDSYFADTEEVNRAPIAIATVKFLQKLPAWAMDLHLQGIILTMLHLLLSRSFVVRESARKSVTEITQTLGPAYLPIILNDLRQNLTRGYQVHVMIYTVHCLIACMQSVLKPGDLDDCFEDIFEVKQQQFGQVDDERQIGAIKAKTPEAKSVKISETFIMLGRFISSASLDKFIEPMKEIIDEAPNAATFKKLQDLLRALSNGLRYNEGITPVELLKFAQSTLEQYIKEMCQQQDALRAQELQEKQEREAGYRPKHCLLLAAEPKRVGAVVKTSSRSKVAIFVEFGLQLLGDILAEKHFDSESDEDVKRLNPYFNLVLEALRLKYEKTTTLALRALGILLKFPLPSIQDKMPTLVDRLFILLAEYANASGNTKLNVNELNQHLFKSAVIVLRQAPENLLTKHRLQILLNHVESDLLDPHKQATAFTLAKAIIGRQIQSDKVDELVKYLAELSVTSPIEQTRSQARSTIHTFFRMHQDGSANANKWLKFFLEQLNYEFVHGRLSALESIRSLFRHFNKEVLDQNGFSTFVLLASRFLKDDEVACHKAVCAAIQPLIVSVSDAVRNDIYVATKDWIESEKSGPRYIGARAMAELVKVQEFKMNNERVKSLLSTVVNRYFNQEGLEDVENEVEVSLNLLIELIRNHLDLMKNVLKKSPNLQKSLIEGIPHLLTFSNTESVCYSSASLLEHLLASTKSIWPLLSKYVDLKELCNRSIQQLNFKSPSDQFVEEAVKNLVTLSVQVDEQTFDGLCEKLARLPKNEIKRDSSTTKRLSLFKFMVAQLVHFENETPQFNSLIKHLGANLFRELSGKSTRDGAKLLEIATDLASTLREKIGENEFNSLLAAYQIESSRRQAERKRERNELLISDQQLAAKNKQHKNAKKSDAKKRKIDVARPYRVQKRRRREEIERTGEYD